MITVTKQKPNGEVQIQYEGELIERTPDRVVIHAFWTHPKRETAYTVFEPGDLFTEYYYTQRWFNIFDIAGVDGKRKGWYCNIAQPAIITNHNIQQVDLYLDVWVDLQGEVLLLDEDEFLADATLSQELRSGAQQGLHDLLELIAAREEMFSHIDSSRL